MRKFRLLLAVVTAWGTMGLVAAPSANACEPHKKSCGSCWINLDGGPLIECHS